MSLNEYRESHTLSYKKLASLLGFSENKTYRLCQDSGCVKLSDAHIIFRVTDGVVSYEDLLGEC